MNNKDSLIYNSRPDLKNPYIICGLKGWINGGEVSVAGIDSPTEEPVFLCNRSSLKT
jgi:hypothetical protein